MSAPLRIGSLCSGYGGLDMAVESVLDARTAWVSDIDKGACKVLAHRYPGVPNLGDMTAIDWTQVEPVDVITGGTPCQDLSHAGKRAGMTEGARSNLWVSMREAIATIRPSLVVWENVGGAYSAEADSELVSSPRLLADTRRRDGEPVLRALGRVLGDLSSLGYVGGWHGLRAADVGAPHGRLRVFVVAIRAGASQDARGLGRLERGIPASLQGVSRWSRHRPEGSGGMGVDGASVPTLLPTPAVNDMGRAYTPETWDAWTAQQQAKHGNGNGHGKSLEIEAQRLLPTPRVTQPGYANDGRGGKSLDVEARLLNTPSVADALGGHETRGGARSDEPLLNGQAKAMHGEQWGDYSAAIARWERVLGRPAPAPTMTSIKGNPQLSPAFTEWMMGLPAGWITDVPGVTRNEALKLCGNGVVPQQAAAALRFLLAVAERGAA